MTDSATPPLPSSAGERRKYRDRRGEVRYFRIEDEICHLQEGRSDKVLCFQKIWREHIQSTEFRLGYYVLGPKSGTEGRWA
jgi:hypothetical protein